ncbi:MAG TPA: hypothetical protein VGM03_23130 [Phycisphaerae bacterium]
MFHGIRSRCARCAGWWIEHNPTYLLSAACIAAGARLYLVTPTARAGDIGLILLTLGVLQIYESLVVSVLLVLHRRRRAPEDEPSLLLVAALFWTGPLAATMEMTARNSQVGLICALGAALIALIEMRVVRRVMSLHLSLPGRLTASGCVLLVALIPPLLRVPERADGANELHFYWLSWLVGALALGLLLAIRSHARACRRAERPLSSDPDFRWELAFLSLVIGALAVHLIGMQHAFFLHARPFYAAPLMAAIAVVVFDGARVLSLKRPLTYLMALLPIGGLLLAAQPFDPDFPLRRLPAFLRDPLVPTAVLAAAALWFGALRHASSALLHAGSVALAIAVYRATPLLLPPGIHADPLPRTALSREQVVLLLAAVAGYLFFIARLRRAKPEAIAALCLQQAAMALYLWKRTPADILVTFLLAGWSTLVAIHIVTPRPRLLLTIWPVIFLVVTAWMHDFEPELQWIARAHTLGLIGVLLLASGVWPWRRYQAVASAVATANLVFFFARWIITGANPTAGLIVAGGFMLLMIGAYTSWQKRKWLCRADPHSDPAPDVIVQLSENTEASIVVDPNV